MNEQLDPKKESITQLYAELGSIVYNLENLEKYIKQLKAQKAYLIQELSAISNPLENNEVVKE